MVCSKDFNVLTADIRTIHGLLKTGGLNITAIIQAYLGQIEKYNPSLRAILYTAPAESLLDTASKLDREWQAGMIRGPLHGIPILLKDNIDTHPSLGMSTSAGSLALLKARPYRNAIVVDQLIKAGAIILGKTNLSEFMNCKGKGMMAGWSAVGGQCVSAYVRGGIQPKDKHAGHSSPGGSSTGSAVGVSAGFAPVSLGTETSGSLIEPATRAALYTLKPTIGLISQSGCVPVSHTFDSVGPMTKTPYDLAVVLDALIDTRGSSSFTEYLNGSWAKLRVGSLNVDDWRKDAQACEPDADASQQMDSELNKAYDIIASSCGRFVPNINLVSPTALDMEGVNAFSIINNADFRFDLEEYLKGLDQSEVRTIQELIKFNEDHSEEELPSHHNNQDVLKMVVAYPYSIGDEKYNQSLAHLRRVSREEGIDLALQNNDIDVIIGPADSELASIAAASGQSSAHRLLLIVY